MFRPCALVVLAVHLAKAVGQPIEVLAPPTLQQPAGGCFIAKGAVSYKYAPGDVYPNSLEHPHGLRLTDSLAQCCALCESLKNCTFFSYEHGLSPAGKPTCYSWTGGCCFLKTTAAKGASAPTPGATSGSTQPITAENCR